MTTPRPFSHSDSQPPQTTDPEVVRAIRDVVALSAAKDSNMVAAALMEKTLKEERYQSLLKGIDDDEC